MITHRVRDVGKVAIIVVLLFGTAEVLHAQWVRCGPQGGQVSSFASIGTMLFTSTEGLTNQNNGWLTSGGGIFASTDSGSTWLQVNSGLPDSNINSLFAAGGVLYAVLDSSVPYHYTAVYRSTDFGAHWMDLPSFPLDSTSYYFDSLGSAIFSVTQHGDYESFDSGITWSNVKLPPTAGISANLVSLGTSLYVVDTSGTLFRSIDMGTNWTLIDTGISELFAWGSDLVNFVRQTNNSYNVTFLSSDGGKTWTQNGEIPIGGCTVLYGIVSSNNIMVTLGMFSDAYISFDGGVTWSETPFQTNSSAQFNIPFAYFGGYVFAGPVPPSYGSGSTNFGVVRSSDNGINWLPSSNGMPLFAIGLTSGVNSIGVVDHVVYATGATAFNNSFVTTLRSTDGGASWSVDSVLTDTAVVSYATMGNILLASSGYGIFRSGDDGHTWVSYPSDVSFDRLLVDGPALFAVSDYAGLFRSMDTGKTWTNVGSAIMSDPESGWDLVQIATNGSTIYTAPSSLYASTDLGKTWKDLTGGLPLNGVSAISASGSNICVAGGIYGTSTIYSSSDGGRTWSAKAPGFDVIGFDVNTLLQSGKSILAASKVGPMLSQDNGSTWTFAGIGIVPDSNSVFSFAIMDSTIYAATANGVWKQQRSEIPFDVARAEVAQTQDDPEIELAPNPTAGSITISGSFNRVTVSNLLGDEVMSSSTQKRTLDLSQLPAGTYFVRIETPNGVVVRRIVKE